MKIRLILHLLFWGRVWDWIKGKVGGLVGLGPKCTKSIKPILDKDRKPIGVMVTYTCTGL
jgi:hypothetical protein